MIFVTAWCRLAVYQIYISQYTYIPVTLICYIDYFILYFFSCFVYFIYFVLYFSNFYLIFIFMHSLFLFIIFLHIFIFKHLYRRKSIFYLFFVFYIAFLNREKCCICNKLFYWLTFIFSIFITIFAVGRRFIGNLKIFVIENYFLIGDAFERFYPFFIFWIYFCFSWQ